LRFRECGGRFALGLVLELLVDILFFLFLFLLVFLQELIDLFTERCLAPPLDLEFWDLNLVRLEMDPAEFRERDSHFLRDSVCGLDEPIDQVDHLVERVLGPLHDVLPQAVHKPEDPLPDELDPGGDYIPSCRDHADKCLHRTFGDVGERVPAASQSPAISEAKSLTAPRITSSTPEMIVSM
jgi:hypothetical protein